MCSIERVLSAGLVCGAAALLLGSAWGAGGEAPQRGRAEASVRFSPSQPWIEVERRRAGISDLPGLLQRLGVRPDMSILDLGAGTGQFAYQLAEQLRGSGRVFATDCEPALVDYMAQEARRRGLSVLTPVLVGREGEDPFYRGHRFDLIFLSHVYNFLGRRVEFMRALRESLSENGRLVIVHYDWSPYAETVPEPQKMVQALAALPRTDAFFLALSSATAARLRDPGADAGQTAARAVRDFNAAVKKHFFTERLVQDGKLPAGLAMTARERAYAEWILFFLSKQGELAFPPSPNRLMRLNGLLLESRFKGFLRVPVNRNAHWIETELTQAGYRLDFADWDFAPTEFALVFSRAPQGRP